MLSIETCTSNYLVSRDHPLPEKIRDRLDGIVRRKLPAALAGAFGGEAESATGLWFVRSLDVDLDIDAGWDDDEIARRWAGRIAVAFGLATAEGGADALFFPDRPAYLAAYLEQAAGGRAAQAWFFQSFSGLSVLPISAAIRTAVEEDPDTGWTALIRMDRDGIEKVLAALTESDARRLLAVLGGRAAIPAAAPALLKEGTPETRAGGAASRREALASLWERWSAPLRALSEAGEALFHFLAAFQERPAPPGGAAAEAALALTRLARRLRAEGPQAHSLLAALAGGDLATLHIVAGAGDAERLRPLLDAAPDWIWKVGRTLAASPRTGCAAEADSPGAAVRHTPFGGAFLLLPLIDSLPAPDPAWPPLDSLPADAALRFLLLVRCLGRERFESAFGDPLLRDLFRVPPALSLQEAADWQRALPPRLLAGYRRRVLEWQTETGLCNRRRLWVAPLAGSSAAVGVEPESGAWVWLGGTDRRGLARLNRLLPPDTALICADEELRRGIMDACPGRTAEPFDATRLEESETHLRSGRLVEDAAYLRSPGWDPARNEAERVWTAAAQNILRAFARRLPGFSRSGLDYLFRNFLDAVAAVEDRPDRRVVRLSRPPLDVVLSMAGLNRGSYSVRGPDERPFELFPQE
jgi:hypothetical protein